MQKMNDQNLGTEYLLATSTEEYFNSLNPSEAYLSKLNRLKEHLPSAGTIVSIGIAGGEDICTLAKLYGGGTTLIGIDISPVALDLARKTTFAAGVTADFIEGNAYELDLPDRSIDGFILSAVLHEVYSYADEGKDALAKTIQEVYRKTGENGCIFISDFAAPRIQGRVNLLPKTHKAMQFIDYFESSFRKFNNTQQGTDASNIAPSLDSTSCSDPAFVSELLWHFKHYVKKFDGELTANNYPQGWKEINESYLPFDPLSSDNKSMPIDGYINVITKLSKSAEMPSDFSLQPVSAALTPQKTGTIDLLDEHFAVSLDTREISSRDFLVECTNWMDLVFKKTQIKLN